MNRAVYMLIVAGLLALLGSCSSGGGTDAPADDGTPLAVALFAASPNHGFADANNPLRVTLTWNISGGKAPYYYALDWNNDAANPGNNQYDWYLNKVYNKTYSVTHDYYFVVGLTDYQAKLRVTDSEGTVVESPLVPVTINNTQGFTVDPSPTVSYADNDDNANNAAPGGDFLFPSADPVYFRSAILNGAPPVSYQWDFDDDGNVDSTVQTPVYTFTYEGQGVQTFLVHLTVVDGNGERAQKDYLVIVQGTQVDPQPIPSFEIVLSTDPPSVGLDPASGYPMVDVPFQPGSTNPAVPAEPKLDLSVVVNPDPNKSGVPPYEYYWDYENDGAFDSQYSSPTIPYYDDVRKILVNPYTLLASENQKTFILRCLVIDGAGRRQEEMRAIIVRRIAAQPGEFAASPSYGMDGGPFDGKPFAEISDADPDTPGLQYPESKVKFDVTNITGGVGFYEWKIDIDNDGFPEADWASVTGTSLTYSVSFGPVQGITTWPAVGYYPVRLSIRAVDPFQAPPAILDELTFDMPVSLVLRPATDEISGVVKARAQHNITLSYDDQSRTMLIMGGAQGTTPLRDVERLVQTVDGDSITPDPIAASALTSFTYDRYGALFFNDEADGSVHLMGGYNLVNQILASMETQPLADILSNMPWTLYGEMCSGKVGMLGYLPLHQAMGDPVLIAEPLWWVDDSWEATYVIVGGLHPPGGDVDEVSGRLISFDPRRPLMLPPQPDFVAMDGTNRGMLTERYDGTAIYLPNEHKLYVIGGRVASGQSVSTVEAFNFESGQWEIAPSLQSARSGHVAVAVDDGFRTLIYVLGGAYYPPGGAQRTISATAEVFNPETGAWSYTLPPAIPTENGAGAGVPSKETISGGDKWAIWYFGGLDAGGAESNKLQELVYATF